MKIKYAKSVFLSIVGLLLVVGSLALGVKSTGATGQDQCNQLFTYEKSNDFDDSRVHINFESGDEQIDVSAQSGYAISRVWLDVENDNHSGYFQYSSGPLNNFNPNPGGDIEEAKVEVKKVCASPSPIPSPSPSLSPSPSPSPSPSSSPSPSPSPSPTPSTSPSPIPSPSVIPSPSPSPDDDCEGNSCNTGDPSPSPSPDPTPESTPSASPSTGGSSSSSNNNSSSSNNSGGQVLGAQTLAPTGYQGLIFMLFSGISLITLGIWRAHELLKRSAK